MSRPIFDTSNISDGALKSMNNYDDTVVDEVTNAIASNKVVVVGMKGNPHCKKAISYLGRDDIDHCYLEYGGYMSEWKTRLGLKMWLGWKTFPMVFVDGKFVGGAAELLSFLKSADSAELKGAS